MIRGRSSRGWPLPHNLVPLRLLTWTPPAADALRGGRDEGPKAKTRHSSCFVEFVVEPPSDMSWSPGNLAQARLLAKAKLSLFFRTRRQARPRIDRGIVSFFVAAIRMACASVRGETFATSRQHADLPTRTDRRAPVRIFSNEVGKGQSDRWRLDHARRGDRCRIGRPHWRHRSRGLVSFRWFGSMDSADSRRRCRSTVG